MGVGQQFAVAARGIGLKDYAKSIEAIVEPTTRGHQVKFVLVYSWDAIPVYPFPFYYIAEIPFLNEDGDWQFTAPESPYHLYRGGISTPRNELVIVDLEEFYSEPVPPYIPDRIWGTAYGYKDAELAVTKGVTTVEGHAYCLGFMQWSELATFACHIYGEMLWDSETQ